jgi:hypothetical protein
VGLNVIKYEKYPMKYHLFVALAAPALLAPAAQAQLDDVRYLDKGRKEQSIRGTITKESPVGIEVKQRDQISPIPAADIVQVQYTSARVPAVDFRAPFGREARGLAPGTRDAQRKQFLDEALTGYRDILAKLTDNPKAQRYIKFKVAEVLAHQGKGDEAIAALTAYKGEHADSWEIVRCLKLLARLQEDKGDIAGARQSYEDLAKLADIPRETKLESDFLVARLLMRGGKYADAEKKLQAVAAALSPNDSQRPQLLVLLAQSQVQQGNLGAVEKQLRDAAAATTDPNVKAAAHNALGEYFLKKNQAEDAFWEFLRVDVLYSQDRDQEAKALYHLSKLFDKVKNDLNRSRDCKERLQKQFADSVYARKSAEEK